MTGAVALAQTAAPCGVWGVSWGAAAGILWLPLWMWLTGAFCSACRCLQAFVLGIDVSRIKVVKIVAGSVILDYFSECSIEHQGCKDWLAYSHAGHNMQSPIFTASARTPCVLRSLVAWPTRTYRY